MTTVADLLALDGISQRAEGVRYDVLDQYLVKIGEVQPNSDVVARVRNSTSRTIRRSLESLRLTPSDADAIDPIRDRIRPSWLIRTPEGTDHEYPLGVFLFAEDPKERNSWGNESTATLIDQGYILDQPVERAWGFDAGSDIGAAVASVLADVAGLATPVIDGGLGQTTGPMAWPIGTRRTEIIDQLLAVGGGLPHYFTNAGVPRARIAPDLTVVLASFTYALDATSLVEAGSVLTYDNLLDAPNRYLVIGDGANNVEVAATYDIPAAAPHSYSNRGYYVTRVERMQGIADSAQAAQAAVALYVSDDQTFAWAEFDAVADPRHDTFDVVSFDGDNYLEADWSLDLTVGGKMHHTLRRFYV